MWNKTDLEMIGKEDGILIAPFRKDGKTTGTPPYIWAVTVADAIYVRPYNGMNSSWYQSAIKQKAGKIISNDMVFAVRFEAADPAVFDIVDSAYRAEYHASQYLPSMLASSQRKATIEILPRKE